MLRRMRSTASEARQGALGAEFRAEYEANKVVTEKMLVMPTLHLPLCDMRRISTRRVRVITWHLYAYILVAKSCTGTSYSGDCRALTVLVPCQSE